MHAEARYLGVLTHCEASQMGHGARCLATVPTGGNYPSNFAGPQSPSLEQTVFASPKLKERFMPEIWVCSIPWAGH